MSSLHQSWLQVGWMHAWQIALLVVAVVMVSKTFARNRPHLAHILWLVVLVKCVTPPIWYSPSGVFCWRHHSQSEPVAGSLDLSGEVASLGSQEVIAIDYSDIADDSEERVLAYAATVPQTIKSAPMVESTAKPVTWWLAVCWLFGSAVIVVSVGLRTAICLWRVRLAGVESVPELNSLVSRLAKKLKIRRRVRLIVTRSLTGPAVIGIFRPTILLPAAIVNRDSLRDVEPILAHELIHVRRGDLWVGLLQVVAQAFWWFHPLVWLANRLATREAERCCDEEAIAELGCDPARYARSLLGVLERKQALRPIPAFPGVRPVEVTSKRLERIMSLGQGCRKRTPWTYWIVMLLVAAITLPGAAFVSAKDRRKRKNKNAVELNGQENRIGRLKVRSNQTTVENNELVVRTYRLNELLNTVKKEFDLDANEARAFLVNHIKGSCASNWETEEKLAVDFDRGDDGELRPHYFAVSGGPTTQWIKKSMVVRQTVGIHDKIAEHFETLRKFGFGQVTLEVKWVQADEKSLSKLDVQWSAGNAATLTDSDKANFLREFKSMNRSLPSTNALPHVRVESVVKQTKPVRFAFLEASSAFKLLVTIQEMPKASVLSAPTVTLFNGQTATICACTQRPFVVNLIPNDEGGITPEIRVVEDGVTMRVRPIIRNDESVWLDSELSLSDIVSVDTFDWPSDKLGKDAKVQVPKVSVTQLDTAVKIPLGQSLVIGGLASPQEYGKSMMIVITPRVVPRDDVLAQVKRKNDSNDSQERALQTGVGVNGNAGVVGDLKLARHEQPAVAQLPRDAEIQLAELVEQFNSLLDNKRYAEAKVTTRRAIEIAPDSEATKAMFWKMKFVDRIIGGEPLDFALDDLRSSTPPPERDSKVPHVQAILTGTVASDSDCKSHGPPSDREVLDAADKQSIGTIGLPYLPNRKRKDVRIVKEKIADYVDPPRFIPQVGSAQIHHAHYKCTVSYADSIRATSKSNPFSIENELVVFIDKRHFHKVPNNASVRPKVASTDTTIRVPDGGTILLDGIERLANESSKTNPAVEARDADVVRADLVDKFNALLEQKRYAEAEVVARQIVECDPESKTWRDVTTVRSPKYKIEKALLDNKVLCDFDKRSLSEIIKSLATSAGVNIVIDPQGLAAEGVTTDTPISLQLTQPITIRSILNLILEPLHLKYAVGEEVVTITSEAALAADVYAKVYNVSDLVIPIKNQKIELTEKGYATRSVVKDDGNPDFDSLIELITTTIQPQSWDEVGGPGAIEPFPTNLSLVVSQTEEVHAGISDLLVQLRRLMDVMVTLNVEVVHVPEQLFAAAGFDELFDNGPNGTLDAEQMKAWRQFAKESDRVKTAAAPKITFFNGQGIELPVPLSRKINVTNQAKVQLVPVISADRRNVRLSLSVDANEALDALAGGKSYVLDGEKTLVVDISHESKGSVAGVPFLKNLPYIGRTFRPSNTDRTIVMITPTIVVIEEEEEKLLVD